MPSVNKETGEVIDMVNIDDMKNITTKLAAIARDMGVIGKTDWNDFNKFKFRGIDKLNAVMSPLLKKYRVLMNLDLQDMKVFHGQTKEGTETTQVFVTVQYIFWSLDDDTKWSTTVLGEGKDSSDKATRKAYANTLKTAWEQVFTIASDEEDPDQSKGIESHKPMRGAPHRASERATAEITPDTVITWGKKYKGMKIRDIETDELYGYMKFMADKAIENKKPLQGQMKAMWDWICIENDRVPKAPSVLPQGDDEPPAHTDEDIPW